LGMGQNLTNTVYFPMRQLAVAEAAEPFLVWALQENLLDKLFQNQAILAAIRRGLEPRVFEQVGALNHVPAKNLPILRGGNRQVYVNSVASQVRAIRDDIVVAHAHP